MNAIITQEMKLACEMFSDAQLMYKSKRYKSCVNRAYYAMFHAVKAILSLKGIDCKTHMGALNKFGQYIVKKGILNEKFAKSLHRSYRLREKSDYAPIFEITKGEAQQVVADADAFVKGVASLLKIESAEKKGTKP